MPGKWAGLRGTVPAAPVESEYQQKVELEKQKFLEVSKGTKGIEFDKLYQEKKALEARISEINVTLDALSQLMIKDLEGDGLDAIRLADGTLLSIKDEPYTSIEDRDKFLAWIHESGQDSLLTVHYQTMNAIAKDRLQQGKTLPPGLKVFLKQSITRRKGKQNG